MSIKLSNRRIIYHVLSLKHWRGVLLSRQFVFLKCICKQKWIMFTFVDISADTKFSRIKNAVLIGRRALIISFTTGNIVYRCYLGRAIITRDKPSGQHTNMLNINTYIMVTLQEALLCSYSIERFSFVIIPDIYIRLKRKRKSCSDRLGLWLYTVICLPVEIYNILWCIMFINIVIYTPEIGTQTWYQKYDKLQYLIISLTWLSESLGSWFSSPLSWVAIATDLGTPNSRQIMNYPPTICSLSPHLTRQGIKCVTQPSPLTHWSLGDLN